MAYQAKRHQPNNHRGYRGSVLVDYRILRNFVRIYHSAGAA
ncbi:YlcG family protein [Salmonella enterica]|nr:YlcG family protein [Salmonella enterica]